MRNFQMYTWSNLIGIYSSRTVFVEVFTDYDDNGTIDWDTGLDGSGTDYRGVYVLMEKIKRDDNRVDIARLLPGHNSEPEITGGYLLKKDWESYDKDPYISVVTSTYNDALIYWDPEPDELTSAQKSWITNYFNDFEAGLAGSNFDNPAHADYYGNYIDIGSFIDHHILVEIANNVDGFVLSTYLFKDRGGKINMGSIWDYNGSLGGADYFCNPYPDGWLYEFDENVCAGGGESFPADNPEAYAWYERLHQDSEYLLTYADHWYQLREDVFATASMLGDIDNNVDVLTDNGAGDNPVNRNYARWDNLTAEIWPNYLDNGEEPSYPLTYPGYVQWMKDWLSARLPWMDGEIDTSYGDYPPEILLNGSPANEGGHANVGDSVTMTSSGGTIYYTTDGNDPREHGGSVYSGATAYSSAITLTGSEQFKARINNSGDWSALNEATFAVGPVADNLRITEIMYHPDDAPSSDPNGEFVELKNISGGTTISLNHVKFTNGIDFTFPDIDLGPGQYVVVVVNPAVFASEYPSFSGINAGKYTGRLSNAGERIELEDAVGQTILNFSFKDGWYPITDGNGFSLNIISPTDPCTDNWEYQEFWQPSSVVKGTPGADDTSHVAAPGDIVINEVLAHSDGNPYDYDWIELHNTTDSTINIGGWFLSDNDSNYRKYEIATGDPRAPVPAGGYVVFTETGDFDNAGDPGSHEQFALSEHGDTVYLCSGSSGQLTGGFCAHEDFADSEADVTFGRYIKSPATANDVDFVPMATYTYSSENTAGPKIGPVVITEIMYHPSTTGQLNNYAEYVELYNTSGGSVTLDDWKFTDETGDIEFYFPPGTSLGSGQRMLLVKNLAAFVNEFGTPSVTAFEWLDGRLSNAGEKIQLSKPGEIEPDGYVPYYRVDRVNYSDGDHHENFHELGYVDPWPTSPDGGGDSLHRITPGNYGNDVSNWTDGSPSPGA
jgi:hypothetical protein